jgi:hypothetical protein
MNLLTSELQKLEKLKKLLKSATNARQRQMYQSLLDKAHQDAKDQKLASEPEVQSRIDAPTKVSFPKKQKQKKQTTKQVREKTEAEELKTSKKVDSQKSSMDHGEEVILEQEKSKKAEKSSQAKEKAIFQGIGLIRCTPQIKEDQLYITVDGQQYDLRIGNRSSREYFARLKLDIEQKGSRELWMRVYPKIAHDLKKQKISYFFTLVKTCPERFQAEKQREGFVIRGIWHHVFYCSEPVISIYRNIDMLQSYKQLSLPAAKKAFARPQAFPVVWSAPVQPYRHNPQLENDQQMPRYFVQVRAIFKNGQFEVVEMLEEPTLDIPRYIKPQKLKI